MGQRKNPSKPFTVKREKRKERKALYLQAGRRERGREACLPFNDGMCAKEEKGKNTRPGKKQSFLEKEMEKGKTYQGRRGSATVCLQKERA